MPRYRESVSWTDNPTAAAYFTIRGRVERFFGTLKQKLDRLAVDSLEALNGALGEFRFFYNNIRPHQNLGGATPAEAWAGIDPYTSRFKDEYWFEALDGLLRGYHLRR